MMVDLLVVKRKLQKMTEYLNELESMQDISLDDYLSTPPGPVETLRIPRTEDYWYTTVFCESLPVYLP